MSKGYKEIADILEQRITSGALAPGSYVPSRHELCEQYHISNVTAARVHNELKARNLVMKIQGSGVEVLGPFLPPGQRQPPARFSKVVMLQLNSNDKLYGRLPILYNHLRSTCAEKNIDFEIRYSDILTSRQRDQLIKKPDTSTAYVIPYQQPLSGQIQLSQLLPLIPDIHSVVLDFIMPNAYCIVFDCYSGMDQLVQYVFDNGARKILYADQFYSLCNFYTSDRRIGCETACRRRGMKFRAVDSGSYEEILDILHSPDAPDAVMCQQDAVAVRLEKFMEEDGIAPENRPMLTGFDGYSLIGGAENLATMQCDRSIMAKALTELLFNRPANPAIHDIIRLPGILKQGPSVSGRKRISRKRA